MRRADILARVDELIETGRLETTGGPYPVLRLPSRGGRLTVGASGSPSWSPARAPTSRRCSTQCTARRRRSRSWVVAWRRSRAAAGLERARARGRRDGGLRDRRTTPDRAARDAALADWLEAREVELVVLAGFMELLGAGLHPPLRGPHRQRPPALLPAFPGIGAIEQAVDHGVKVTGVTVHFVDEGVDSGPIVLQEPFELPYPAGIAAIEERVHGVEHGLLPRAVRLIAEGAVVARPGTIRARC